MKHLQGYSYKSLFAKSKYYDVLPTRDPSCYLGNRKQIYIDILLLNTDKYLYKYIYYTLSHISTSLSTGRYRYKCRHQIIK